MPFQNEPIAAMVAGCCSPLQYLEGAAYIAIVLAVLGVPQLLTYYLDQRNRRNERREDQAEAERIRQEERAETERVRQETLAEAERVRRESLVEAERVRQESLAEAERIRREERADAERVRREERVESERRHQEMMTALIAIVERNGHAPPEQTAVIRELRQRINRLEAENARLRASNGNGNDHFDAVSE